MNCVATSLPSVQVERHPDKGRSLHVSSPRGIPSGTKIFQEEAFAKVVLSTYKGNVCAECLRPSDPDICCDDCSQVTFCSEACQASLASIHALECETLDDIDMIAKKSAADRDLLRLLVRILCRRVCPCPRRDETDELLATTFSEVDQMVHVTSRLEPSWVASVERGAELLLQSLPTKAHVSVTEIVGLAGRINENSYSLDAWTSSKAAAVGMFPVAALLNHSCMPNCAWANDGRGHMEVRTTAFVAHGEELCFSYIDPTQPRPTRQRELLATKHFQCTCPRCSDSSIDGMDAMLEGVCCGVCLDFLQPGAGSSRCCHQPLQVDDTDVQRKTESARESLRQIQNQVDTKQFAAARVLALELLQAHSAKADETSSIVLHPSHEILTRASQLVGECDWKLGDYVSCVGRRLDWIARLEKTVAPMSLVLAHAHHAVVEAFKASFTHNAWPAGTDLKAKEALAAWHLQQCRHINSVCLPARHPLNAIK
ncbi:hypothetical protein DYB37_002775 [Aphanomyces astaci]|uniref:SET domain-containing protein n=1 Tax=Aphanomyces astaci TaxID=112090 RepID=A0A418DVG5_APHAT|nr:hypothetical protein DYB35_012593 [Aphanomyces astaci]RHZ06670.1 hypothetical protein DYB37_002775 [Aphanomyces astaci]